MTIYLNIRKNNKEKNQGIIFAGYHDKSEGFTGKMEDVAKKQRFINGCEMFHIQTIACICCCFDSIQACGIDRLITFLTN